jgi:hypothetical protein
LVAEEAATGAMGAEAFVGGAATTASPKMP